MEILKISREAFQESIGKTYHVELPEGRLVDVILREVGALVPPPENSPKCVRSDPFFLVFHGFGDAELPTGILKMTDPVGKEYNLAFNAEGYINGNSAKGHQYYVVIN